MKILLIDDKANEGWKQVLYKTLPLKNLTIETATTYIEASSNIHNFYDLIFLDVRLNEKDHSQNEVTQFSGYRLLKEIKETFLSINFSTPIILFTASNKIWNIDSFRAYGVDSYYIKEHPDFIFDIETSRQNLKNLQLDFENLLQEGVKRKDIWKKSGDIIEILSEHHYFQGDRKYINVKNRIIDKLKLGYAYLFKKQTLVEKELLMANNETLAFIIYWSILEEIVKGFSDYNTTWQGDQRQEEWRFRNSEYFIERKNNQNFIINYYIDYQTGKRLKNTTITRENLDKRFGNVINLSDQVYSLLFAYSSKTEFQNLSEEFRLLNKSRNEIDFIHSSINNIFFQELIREEDLESMYQMNRRILEFILQVCSLLKK